MRRLSSNESVGEAFADPDSSNATGSAEAAWAELATTRQIGVKTLGFLVRTTTRVARQRGFPPPSGHTAWDDDAAIEWLNDVFFPRRGFDLPIQLRASLSSPAALATQCAQAIHWTLKDEAKSTQVGLMMERLRSILSRVPGVINARDIVGADAWTLESCGTEVFDGDWHSLPAAPELRQVPPLEALNRSGPTSQLNRERLAQASVAMLRRANGAVRAADLASAIVLFFEIGDPVFWPLLEADERDDEQEPPSHIAVTRPGFDAGDLEWAEAAADGLLAQFSDEEGRLLAYLDQPLAVIQEMFPNSRVNYRDRDALKRKVAELHRELQPPPGAWDIVMFRCDEANHWELTRPDSEGGSHD